MKIRVILINFDVKYNILFLIKKNKLFEINSTKFVKKFAKFK